VKEIYGVVYTKNRFADLADHIIDYLKKHDGVMNITAKSSTEIIEKE
jgi:predicted RNA-binding protein (virulence factor B family)